MSAVDQSWLTDSNESRIDGLHRTPAAGMPVTQSSCARQRKRTRVRRNEEVNARAAGAATTRTLRLWGVKRRLFPFKTCARLVLACARNRRRAVPVFHCGSGVIGRIAGRHVREGIGGRFGSLMTRGNNRRTNSIGSVLLQVVPSRETAERDTQVEASRRSAASVNADEGGLALNATGLHRNRIDTVRRRGQLKLCRSSRGQVREQSEGQGSSEGRRRAKRVSRMSSSDVTFLHPESGDEAESKRWHVIRHTVVPELTRAHCCGCAESSNVEENRYESARGEAVRRRGGEDIRLCCVDRSTVRVAGAGGE
eukprot:3893388-Pleurochrysis_carterae.AAC.2